MPIAAVALSTDLTTFIDESELLSSIMLMRRADEEQCSA